MSCSVVNMQQWFCWSLTPCLWLTRNVVGWESETGFKWLLKAKLGLKRKWSVQVITDVTFNLWQVNNSFSSAPFREPFIFLFCFWLDCCWLTDSLIGSLVSHKQVSAQMSQRINLRLNFSLSLTLSSFSAGREIYSGLFWLHLSCRYDSTKPDFNWWLRTDLLKNMLFAYCSQSPVTGVTEF